MMCDMCYNIEIGRPVFDRIELNPIPKMNTTTVYIVDTCKMQRFFYFLCYVQAVQPVPSTKIEASSMTANTIMMA